MVLCNILFCNKQGQYVLNFFYGKHQFFSQWIKILAEWSGMSNFILRDTERDSCIHQQISISFTKTVGGSSGYVHPQPVKLLEHLSAVVKCWDQNSLYTWFRAKTWAWLFHISRGHDNSWLVGYSGMSKYQSPFEEALLHVTKH